MLLIYGANGYTGRLIADECARRDVATIVAGRREDGVREVGARHGFPYRIFGLATVEEIVRHLDSITAVLHCAGPFAETSARVVDACLRRHVHYLDITGEIGVFETCRRRGEEARAAEIVLLPGVGFDVVPSDCLAAALAAVHPGGVQLQLAFAGAGALSPGTARTMLAGLSRGGAIRRDGRIVPVPLGWKRRSIPFHDRERECMTIPWGDVSTAFVSTGIPTIETYTTIPPLLRRWLPAVRLLAPLSAVPVVRAALARRIEKRITGPSAEARERGQVQLWARIVDGNGASSEATLTTPEAYRLTAMTAVESAVRLMQSPPTRGYHTPVTAFGADFIIGFPGCTLRLPS